MFVQDSSGSMADDIQTFRTLATSLVNAVLKLSKTAMTGLASFIEKPVFPQVRLVSRHDALYNQMRHFFRARAFRQAIQSTCSLTARFETTRIVSRAS